MHGRVKKLFADKGFGFIRGEDGVERFFHRDSCETPFRDIREGTAVRFEEAQSDKGPRAEAVQLAQ